MSETLPDRDCFSAVIKSLRSAKEVPVKTLIAKNWFISPEKFWELQATTGVTPFFRIMFPYFAVSPVMTTAKAERVLS